MLSWSFGRNDSVECQRPRSLCCRPALHRTDPGDGHRNGSLTKDLWVDHIGHRDRPFDILELSVVHQAIPEITIPSRLDLGNGVTVRGALSINSVVAARVPSVEIDALHHFGRHSCDTRQLIRINVPDQ